MSTVSHRAATRIARRTDPRDPCDCTPVCEKAGQHVPLLRMKRSDRAKYCGKTLAFGLGPHTFCTKRCRDAGYHVRGEARR